MIKEFISRAGVTGRRELVFHAKKKRSQVAGIQLFLKYNVSSCSCCSQVQKNRCDTSDGMVPITIHGAKPEEVGYWGEPERAPH